jgi:aminopeptidase N
VIRYHGQPRETSFDAERADSHRLGFAVHRDGSAVALQEPYGAFTWYPSNDQPSDKALYDIAITVPKGWAGVSSGTFQGKAVYGNTAVYRWHSGAPTASYLVTFVADRLTMMKQTGPHGLPLTYWFRAKDRKKNIAALRQSPKIIAWLEKRLGPYPFPSGGAVIAGDSGMETQQMITMSSGQPANVYAHEYTHQWFGDTVTPRTWRSNSQDLWIKDLGCFVLGLVVGSFDEFAVGEGCAGADEGDQVRCVHRAPAGLCRLDQFEGHGQPRGP